MSTEKRLKAPKPIKAAGDDGPHNSLEFRTLPVAPDAPELVPEFDGVQAREIVRVDILGVTVNGGGLEDMAAFVQQRILSDGPTKIAFLNANLSNVIASNPMLRKDIGDFVVLNDGIGMDIAAYLIHGRAFPQNLNGTDFIPFLLSATTVPLRLFLLGGRAGVAARAATAVRTRWPRHAVVGWHDGYLNHRTSEAVLGQIRAADPDLVLVAMGNPAQELWISENAPRLGKSAIGVGAWFDFISGDVGRAPEWVRCIRMEWVYRLVVEPRRLWKRYLVGNFIFLWRVLLASRHRITLGHFGDFGFRERESQ